MCVWGGGRRWEERGRRGGEEGEERGRRGGEEGEERGRSGGNSKEGGEKQIKTSHFEKHAASL